MMTSLEELFGPEKTTTRDKVMKKRKLKKGKDLPHSPSLTLIILSPKKKHRKESDNAE